MPEKDPTSAKAAPEETKDPSNVPDIVNGVRLNDQQKQALAEARQRQKMIEEKAQIKELNGPKGPEPTRYGDWERKGRVSDF